MNLKFICNDIGFNVQIIILENPVFDSWQVGSRFLDVQASPLRPPPHHCWN